PPSVAQNVNPPGAVSGRPDPTALAEGVLQGRVDVGTGRLRRVRDVHGGAQVAGEGDGAAGGGGRRVRQREAVDVLGDPGAAAGVEAVAAHGVVEADTEAGVGHREHEVADVRGRQAGEAAPVAVAVHHRARGVEGEPSLLADVGKDDL